MAKRKIGNSHTTICKTKNGNMYESDSVIFNRMLESFKLLNESDESSHETYPRKITSQEHVQQD